MQHLLGYSGHAFTADVYGTVPDALARGRSEHARDHPCRDAAISGGSSSGTPADASPGLADAPVPDLPAADETVPTA